MSNQGFNDFIRAAEHSSSLRRSINACKGIKEITLLASKYGFAVSIKDLEEEKTNQNKLEHWFSMSKINPINKIRK